MQKHKTEGWKSKSLNKECRTEKFTRQKRNYMHDNSCVARWRLCGHTKEYPHPSAALIGMAGHNALITDYREFLLRQWEEVERGDTNLGIPRSTSFAM